MSGESAAVLFAPFLRKLQRNVLLDACELQDLLTAFGRPRRVPRGGIVGEESRAGETVTVLLEGLACSSRSMARGQQQTVALHMPGDLLDGAAFLLGVERPTVLTFTPAVTASVSYSRLKALILDRPRIALALWSDMAADGAIAQEWLTGLGRRSALENVAHFICELHWRHQAAGLAGARSFKFPLTQEQLGAVMGLSVVHINRVLKQLKQDRLITLSRAALTVIEAEELAELAGFDPCYLRPPMPAFLHMPNARPREDVSFRMEADDGVSP